MNKIRIYNIDAYICDDGITRIFKEDLGKIFELYFDEEYEEKYSTLRKIKEEKNKKQKKEFCDKLCEIFTNCVINIENPFENPNCIIGESTFTKYYYDKTQINLYKNEIYDLINRLKKPVHYYDLKTLKCGEKWTTIKEHLAIFMTLVNAAGFIEFENNELTHMYNPKLILKRNEK